MFAGHIGAGLALARVERRVPMWHFVAAALWLDFVLWLFVLLGWERVVIPANFASTHQPEFSFPISHGLLAAVAWSAAAGAMVMLSCRSLGDARMRAALVIAAAVFSHWLLDALVHTPEMPLAGEGSPRIGLGLWNQMTVALCVEAAISLGGLAWFIRGAGLSRGRAAALVALVLFTLVSTVAGMTVAPAPPSAVAMAATSLLTIAAVAGLAAWLGRRRA